MVCQLKSLNQFGHSVLPRGSYLAGHLEAEKEPGHFVGKGFLKLEFDRVCLPNTCVPVPGKVIAVQGYRVDRQGDVIGHGHATRDTVEWLLPPLKLVNVMRYLPPTFASSLCTVQVKPFGGSHFASAAASRKAR